MIATTESRYRWAGALLWTVYVLAPGDGAGLVQGVPLHPSGAVALVLIWWLAVVGCRLPLGRMVAAAAVTVMIITMAVPGEPGLRGRYYRDAAAHAVTAGDFTHVDRQLNFSNDAVELPLASFESNQAFSAVWDGRWWTDVEGVPHTVYIRPGCVGGACRRGMGDQVRDWTIALGPFTSLPLVGVPSNGGGNSFGPVYYWVLWISRVTIGPLVNNLPQAGGIGLAAAPSIADAVLCIGIRKAGGSWLFAAATTLLIASCPFDLALSSVIWNPVLAVTFAKIGSGLLLAWSDELTRGRRLMVFAVAWLAVQAHTPAVPVAMSIFLWLMLAGRRRRVPALAIVADAACVVMILQLPSMLAWTTRLLSEPGGRNLAAALLLLLAVLIQKPRLDRAATLFRLPAYGALVRGAETVARRQEPIRRLDAPFLQEPSDPEFVLRILGGRIDRQAPMAAQLSPLGEVIYVR